MKFFFLLITIIIAFTSPAQRIKNFDVFLAGNGVGIKFIISNGTSCNGYNILHSLDSVNYSIIYNFPGICGNTSTDESITYFHTSPGISKNNFYKIELIPIEVSQVKKLFVPEIPVANAIIYPNPIVTATEKLNFRVVNANNIKLTGFIYNQSGIPIRVLTLATIFDIATIDVNEFENDTYLISLSDGVKIFTFKFIINR